MDEEKPSRLKPLIAFYHKNYRKLLVIPFGLLILAILQISIQTATTGDFINKGVSLKGGVTLTIPVEQKVDLDNIENELLSELPGVDINVRSLRTAGQFSAIVVETDLDVGDEPALNKTLLAISKQLGTEIEEYSVEGIGSSLGARFFKEIIFALVLAFLFMGIVVLITFRNLIPSFAVILAAFVDITVTLAIVNTIGIKLSTAGIAAFLMLIGYSVDTNILLTTKVLKRREGTVPDRILNAMRTGLTMTSTTIAAIVVALIVTQSDVIRQIMIILLIGLLVDLISTWVQNVGILRWYLDKKLRIQHEYQD